MVVTTFITLHQLTTNTLAYFSLVYHAKKVFAIVVTAFITLHHLPTNTLAYYLTVYDTKKVYTMVVKLLPTEMKINYCWKKVLFLAESQMEKVVLHFS